MTNKTENINGTSATLFRDGANPVYLLSDGRFACKKGDKWLMRSSIKSLEKLMVKEQPFLTIMQCPAPSMQSPEKVNVREVTAYLENRTVNRAGKKEYCGYGNWYVYIPGVPEKLNDLYRRMSKAEREFYEEYKRIMKDTVSVYTSNFKDLLKGNFGESEE